MFTNLKSTLKNQFYENHKITFGEKTPFKVTSVTQCAMYTIIIRENVPTIIISFANVQVINLLI